MLKISTFLLLGTMGLTAHAQCPESVTVTSNEFCYYLSWEMPPADLPEVISDGGTSFAYSSGSGSTDDPAIYQSGGGGGACNSTQNPFSGTLSFDGLSCSFSSGVLPLKLLTFTAKKFNGNAAIISWATTNEYNISSIEVQRSYDAKDWNTIGVVNAAGSNVNSTVEYSYEDKNIGQNPTTLYRLKINEPDYKYTFSKVAPLTWEVTEDCKYFMSETGILTLSFPLPQLSASVNVWDMQGKQMQVITNKNADNVLVNLNNLPPGLYIIKLSTNNYQRTFKVKR